MFLCTGRRRAGGWGEVHFRVRRRHGVSVSRERALPKSMSGRGGSVNTVRARAGPERARAGRARKRRMAQASSYLLLLYIRCKRRRIFPLVPLLFVGTLFSPLTRAHKMAGEPGAKKTIQPVRCVASPACALRGSPVGLGDLVECVIWRNLSSNGNSTLLERLCWCWLASARKVRGSNIQTRPRLAGAQSAV